MHELKSSYSSEKGGDPAGRTKKNLNADSTLKLTKKEIQKAASWLKIRSAYDSFSRQSSIGNRTMFKTKTSHMHMNFPGSIDN